jgi:asparagine synthetase B (glutamine-hydrolysing)
MNLKETKFRELLIESARRYSTGLPHDTPLCFSGGTDSATCLFALLELHIKPPIYVFQLGEIESTDVRASRKFAEHFKLELHVVKCPQTEEQLLSDVRWYLREIKDTRRAHLQNTQMFMHLAQAMHDAGHKHAYVGMDADGLYGSTREAHFARHRGGEEGFREYRRRCLDDEKELIGTFYTIFSVCQGRYDIELLDLYRHKALAEHVITCDYDDIWNHGYKKLPINAFADYFKQGAFVRKPSPMQINARMREWHDTLNRKYKTDSVVSAYAKILQEMKL